MTVLTLTPLSPGSATLSGIVDSWAYPAATFLYAGHFYPSQIGSYAILIAAALTPASASGSALTPGTLTLTPQ